MAEKGGLFSLFHNCHLPTGFTSNNMAYATDLRISPSLSGTYQGFTCFALI
jgi:hypothetical protein